MVFSPSEQCASAQPFGLGSVSGSVRIKSKSTEKLTPGVEDSRQDTHPGARRGSFALKRLWLQGALRRKAEHYGQSTGFASAEITGKMPPELRQGLNSGTKDAKRGAGWKARTPPSLGVIRGQIKNSKRFLGRHPKQIEAISRQFCCCYFRTVLFCPLKIFLCPQKEWHWERFPCNITLSTQLVCYFSMNYPFYLFISLINYKWKLFVYIKLKFLLLKLNCTCLLQEKISTLV